jgi:hypothetical protein
LNRAAVISVAPDLGRGGGVRCTTTCPTGIISTGPYGVDATSTS